MSGQRKEGKVQFTGWIFENQKKKFKDLCSELFTDQTECQTALIWMFNEKMTSSERKAMISAYREANSQNV